ncbi:MAG: nucleotide pyrophosphohydrolase [Bacteroidetes bacterium]|nr:nucleotide pyrophosphohydrolase [Bacteroidota bacterium]MBU1718836.1 nucleotide pyrophosphohydrolase [Bacteroidota bacterium]
MKEVIEALSEFVAARDWEQFHNPKDLAIAISIEAAELNELYLWKDINELSEVPAERVKEELADVLAYAIMLAKKYNFDIKEIVLEKIKRNAEKYPIEKSKGSALKYNQIARD